MGPVGGISEEERALRMKERVQAMQNQEVTVLLN